MENKKNTGKVILTGAMIASAFLGSNALKANNANPFEYSSLGTGSEVRGTILNTLPSAINALELACGATKTKDAKCGDTKTKDAKCGENKDAKTKDAKCGANKDAKTKDAKCGTKKDDAAKTKDGKCGEGKCGSNKKEEQPK